MPFYRTLSSCAALLLVFLTFAACASNKQAGSADGTTRSSSSVGTNLSYSIHQLTPVEETALSETIGHLTEAQRAAPGFAVVVGQSSTELDVALSVGTCVPEHVVVTQVILKVATQMEINSQLSPPRSSASCADTTFSQGLAIQLPTADPFKGEVSVTAS